MLKTSSQKTVTAGLLMALGVILPFATAHGFGIQGNILLPMHLPVLLCGYLCGPLYGGLLGLLLPFLNGLLTGMPMMYPTAIIMALELTAYGTFSGLIYRLFKTDKPILKIYISLIPALVLGRVVYGLAASVLLVLDAGLGNISVIAATLQGIPGIITQLILVPAIVGVARRRLESSTETAKEMVRTGKYSCVVVKNNKIIHTEKSRGIACIMKLYQNGTLKDTFVADAVVGKAAAMIFTAGGVKTCYGETMSRSSLEWLSQHNIKATYSTLTESIRNRDGTGMCPMESTVLEIDDAEVAIEALKEKLESMKR